jgi:hypothetical protein
LIYPCNDLSLYFLKSGHAESSKVKRSVVAVVEIKMKHFKMKKITEVNEPYPGRKSNSHFKFIIMAAVVCALSSNESFSQKTTNGSGSGGWGMRSQYNSMYDTKTVQTIVGEVVTVEKIVPTRGMSSGVHLVVKTNDESISVHLGPEWFIDNQDISIDPKDKITVKGSRITYKGKPAIIAAVVTKGNDILVLRDVNGIPVWSGWRKY